MRPNSPITPNVFSSDVLPWVVESWSRECLCANPGFLKLLSFDFLDYGQTPAALVDSELIWGAIVGKHFISQGEWLAGTSNRPRRTFQCPQCGLKLVCESEQYSVNMWHTTSRPMLQRELASNGCYLVGIQSFKDFDYQSLTDFALAATVPDFLASIGAT